MSYSRCSPFLSKMQQIEFETHYLIDIPLLRPLKRIPRSELPENRSLSNKLRIKDLTNEYLGLLRPLSAEASFDILRTHMIPTENKADNILFVCIDFEFASDLEKRITEIGISTLDTRDLRKPPNSPISLTTQNYQPGFKYRSHNVKKCRVCKNGQFHTGEIFLWGQSTIITADKMKEVIEQSIQQISQETGKPRNVVLVVHSFIAEVKLIRNLGIDLLDKVKFPGLLGLLDTQVLACSWIRRSHMEEGETAGFRLSHLLNYLGLPRVGLHVAGNDANWTLKALFLLICVRLQEPGIRLSILERGIFSRYIAIARESLPPKNPILGPKIKKSFGREFRDVSDWTENMVDVDLGLWSMEGDSESL